MQLFGSHGVLIHPRRAVERESFISNSLTSPADLNKRLSSSNDDRSRPLVMKFHKYWRHPDCSVNQWYDAQSQSSTKFNSIQHWRNTQGPFFREYLLILLDDGAICRVERIGEGSHKAATTRTGCTAHDIIQWFGPSKYELDPLSQGPAEMIGQVEFPHTFDLLDVLAICWSIQQTPRCSIYTLQRYNCYFLCLTILAVLARRVDEWEGIIDNEAIWSGVVNDIIEDLQRTPCEDADEYVGIGVCDIVDPNHPNPRAFVLDPLRTDLTANGLMDWKTCVSGTLWMKDFEAEIKKGFASCAKDVADTALGGSDTTATELKKILEFNPEDEDSCRAHGISDEFREAVLHEVSPVVVQGISEMVASAERTQQMRELEYQPSLSRRMELWALVPFWYACAVIQGPKAFAGESQMGGPTLHHRVEGQWFRRNPVDALSLTKLLLSAQGEDLPAGCDFDSVANKTSSVTLRRLLESPVSATQTGKLHTLMLRLTRDDWVRSIQACVGKAISNAAKAHIADLESFSKPRNLRTIDSFGQARELTVQELHDYIIDRIRTHGKTVESKGLAAAELVELDLDIAMAEVWKGLPRGYGGTVLLS
ncbi:unnamed protein product [Rhizoctonia solani]|uniref:Uncharacterized protein n=1 Tax=Rhizoctonia solani TaxID=456999 RepID=A0A8H2X5M9_9AGAM|nr:unnamed protein product [Rhizoctonia solani]